MSQALPPFGSDGPPSSVIAQMTAFTARPSDFAVPPGVTGPPAGISVPPGISIPSGLSGPPRELVQHAFTAEQSHILIGVTSMMLVLCLAAVGARLLARRFARMRLEADDWTCVAALLVYTALCVEQFLMGAYAEQLASPNPPKLQTVLKLSHLSFSSQITYDVVTCVAKISVLFLYRRLFSLRTKWFRIMWWSCITVVSIYLVALISAQMTQCRPISHFWNSPGACKPPPGSAGSLGFLNALIDAAILVLPIRTVWNLQMSSSKKFAICCVFGLGFLTVGISLARAAIIIQPNVFAKGALKLVLWSNAEPCAAIICSCLPIMRPLFVAGLEKVGFPKAWSWYLSKRSKSYRSYFRSGPQDQASSNLTGTTLQSGSGLHAQDEKNWYRTTDEEVGATIYGNRSQSQSPVSPLDKPLPPAYTECEGDTAYHTWTWNLLARPRDGRKSPTLSRRGMIRETGSPWRNPSISSSHGRSHTPETIKTHLTNTIEPSPPRLHTHTPILDRSQGPPSPLLPHPSPVEAHSKNEAPRSLNRTPSSASVSFSLPRALGRSSPSMRPLPLDSPHRPARPQPVASGESHSTSTNRARRPEQDQRQFKTHADGHHSETATQTTSPGGPFDPGASASTTAWPRAGPEKTKRPQQGRHISDWAIPGKAWRKNTRELKGATAADLATTHMDGDIDMDRIRPVSPPPFSSRYEEHSSTGGRSEIEKRPAHWSPSIYQSRSSPILTQSEFQGQPGRSRVQGA